MPSGSQQLIFVGFTFDVTEKSNMGGVLFLLPQYLSLQNRKNEDVVSFLWVWIWCESYFYSRYACLSTIVGVIGYLRILLEDTWLSVCAYLFSTSPQPFQGESYAPHGSTTSPRDWCHRKLTNSHVESLFLLSSLVPPPCRSMAVKRVCAISYRSQLVLSQNVSRVSFNLRRWVWQKKSIKWSHCSRFFYPHHRFEHSNTPKMQFKFIASVTALVFAGQALAVPSPQTGTDPLRCKWLI